MKQLSIALVLGFLMASCSITQQSPRAFDKDLSMNETAPITQSLFSDKNSTISEENIQKILDGN